MSIDFLLDTERLKIRYFNENDYINLYEYLSDVKTYKYEPGKIIDIEESKKLCKERMESKIFWAVVLKTENKLIGHIYLNIMEPTEFQIYEIGYIFNQDYHGNGYATESIGEFIKYKFSELNIHKIIAHCNPKNIPSWKLLERLKFKREGKLRESIFFYKNQNDEPIWIDTYEYGLLIEDLK